MHFAVTSGRTSCSRSVQREEGVGGRADAIIGHRLQQAGSLRQGTLLLVMLMMMVMVLLLLLLQLQLLLMLLLLLSEYLLVPTFRATTHLRADA